MSIHGRRRITTAAAGISILALALTACSSSNNGGAAAPSGDASSSESATTGGGSEEQITLTVATFNEFGYADLYKQYMDEHPNIKIVEKKAATSEEARTNMTTKLAAGSGLSDIEAIEIDWLPELLQYPDKFVNLADDSVQGRWGEFVEKSATAADGTLIGYGTDTGPEAVCYRQDLFEAAGLPSDREEVAELLGGDNATWEKYFEVGKQYVDATGKAWFDGAVATYQGMINQQSNAYEELDGTVKNLANNSDVKALYDQVLKASVDDNLSAHLSQWSDDWVNAFQNDGFATMLCPAWMTTVIEGNAAGVTGWNMADVFPGGGGNWGGSYLTVPAQGANTDAAKELANWLTAPEQTAKVFTTVGNYPSQVEAQANPDVQGAVNAFFNDAPTGEIFKDRAAAITVIPFKGPNYFSIHQAVQNALTRVDVDKTDDAASSWEGALSDFESLGLG